METENKETEVPELPKLMKPRIEDHFQYAARMAFADRSGMNIQAYEALHAVANMFAAHAVTADASSKSQQSQCYAKVLAVLENDRIPNS